MKELRKVLVPVDFSEPSQRALNASIELAKKCAAELHLVHVYQLFVPGTLDFFRFSVPPQTIDDFRKEAERALADWSSRVAGNGVSVRTHFSMAGLPADEIVALADRISADMIVMGTQGLSGLEHVLLGSVAEKTIRKAPCPVLTIGRVQAVSAEFHRILVPVDFSDHSQRALEEAIDFARTCGAEVHLLHSYQIHPQSVAPYGIVVPETLDHDLRMAALQRLSEWRDKVTAAGCRGFEHITANFPVDAIQAMADRIHADLIVMGTRGLTGFKHVLLGSVAERTLRTAKCPVLTVKSGARH